MPKRRQPPQGAKLNACLLMLGFTMEQITSGQIEWDHIPALAMREVDDEADEWVPHQHDPRYLTPLLRGEHKVKTNGTKATTAGSDKHMIAKTRRLEAQRKLLGRTKRKGAKRKIASRPFPSRRAKEL